MTQAQEVTGKSTLPTAKLGRNGPQVSRLGYGTMGLVSGQSIQNIISVQPLIHVSRVWPTVHQSQTRNDSKSSTSFTQRVITFGIQPTFTAIARIFLVSCRLLMTELLLTQSSRQVVQAKPRQA
jgi:hypothetical protein